MTLLGRTEILQDLVEYRKKPAEIRDVLLQYNWDCESELVKVYKTHVIAVLRRYVSGEISAQDVDDWANLIECRDDVDYEAVADAIYILANPEMMYELTVDSARRLIERLERNEPVSGIGD